MFTYPDTNSSVIDLKQRAQLKTQKTTTFLTCSLASQGSSMPSKEFKCKCCPENNKIQKATNMVGDIFPRHIW